MDVTRPASHSRSFYISSLDGIRGAAFFLVFFSHAGLGFLIPGGFGVTVFFVLSGYLITTLLRLEYEETGSIDLRAFYLRRAFRILPLYYFVLAAALLLKWAGFTGGSLNAVALFSQLFNWSNYYLIGHSPDSVAGGTGVLWSLAVEEHFYLLFPLLYWQARKRLSVTGLVRLLSAICVLCLVWRCVLIFGMHAPTVRTELGTDTRFDSLLFGALMAIGANPKLDTSRWFIRKRLNVLAILGVTCLLLTFFWRDGWFRYTFRYAAQPLALLPLFAYAILARDSIVFRSLNSKVMTQLGVLSYALYLVHAILLDIFTDRNPHAGFIAGALAFLSALLVAKFLQVAIEHPFQKLRRRYSRVHA
jgi:peptidoglycan/LPS O-acetylase OafA/YrhL